jgi:hypothetical protein
MPGMGAPTGHASVKLPVAVMVDGFIGSLKLAATSALIATPVVLG